MRLLDEILTHNSGFVSKGDYAEFATDRFPSKRMVVLTCMDTRLTELLPRAMNLRNGDAKIIKSAGAVVSHPFGSIMRSILVAVYELGANEIYVVGHHECGMAGLHCGSILDKAVKRGIQPKVIETLGRAGVDLPRWLEGFERVEDGVVGSVKLIKEHPLVPPDVVVHGMLMDPHTGKLDMVVNGYST